MGFFGNGHDTKSPAVELDEALHEAGGCFAEYFCKQSGRPSLLESQTADDAENNIADVCLSFKKEWPHCRYWSKRKGIYVVRRKNWAERTGRISVKKVNLFAGNCDMGGLTNLRLDQFLMYPHLFGGAYKGIEPCADIYSDEADKTALIRFKTVLLPSSAKHEGSESNNEDDFQFAPEAFVDKRSVFRPSNIFLLATSDGLSIREDGPGRNLLLAHEWNCYSSVVDEHWMRFVDDRCDASETGNLTPKQSTVYSQESAQSETGSPSICPQAGMLLTVQIPLKIQTEGKMAGGPETACTCLKCRRNAIAYLQSVLFDPCCHRYDECATRIGRQCRPCTCLLCKKSAVSALMEGKFQTLCRHMSSPQSFEATGVCETPNCKCTACSPYRAEESGNDLNSESGCTQTTESIPPWRPVYQAQLDDITFENTLEPYSEDKDSARLEVSAADKFATCEKACLRDPERDTSRPVVITCLLYKVVDGDFPSLTDVKQAVDNMERLYAACSPNESPRDTEQSLQNDDTKKEATVGGAPPVSVIEAGQAAFRSREDMCRDRNHCKETKVSASAETITTFRDQSNLCCILNALECRIEEIRLTPDKQQRKVTELRLLMTGALQSHVNEKNLDLLVAKLKSIEMNCEHIPEEETSTMLLDLKWMVRGVVVEKESE